MTEEEFSILNLHGQSYDPEGTEAFYLDLNLLQIIERAIANWGVGVKKYYMYLPESAEETAYRRAVYGDVKKDAVYEALVAYTKQLAGVAELRREKEATTSPMRRTIWRIRETEAYCNAYETLARALEQADLASDGMIRFRGILQSILAGEEYLSMRKQTSRLLGEIRALRFVVTYDRERMSVELRELPERGAYDEWLDSVSGVTAGASSLLQNPFKADPGVTEMEQACVNILMKKKPEFFRELKAIAENETDCRRQELTRFEQEILFYLSFATLQRDMEKAGFAFATPDTDENKRMEATGLYDLALALASRTSGKTVIPNDFYYGEGDRFFVLTGPNQGGKTTFARSLGQLVYFSMMGLDVPAKAACVHFFPSIQTHFSVEESIETGRGKLMEELVRLAPMMGTHRQGSFVVINELFTTAANYDAQIMGKRVLDHFVGLGCMGIYVTHIKELADERKGVVSLRAMLNDCGIQTFEIRRGEAEDTACAINQVNKYRLTYEQLKERL